MIASYETLNQESMTSYFSALRKQYPQAQRIHIILDQGPYTKAHKTQEAAKEFGIVLHYLPPYSPNLNPIERLWKIMNEYVCNNRFFKSAQEFRAKIINFFEFTWPNIVMASKDRINNTFQKFNPTLPT